MHRNHGGRRPGSGRKRLHSKGVAHRTREKVQIRTPLHINFKYRLNIRNKDRLRILKRAILNSQKLGLRVNHYSLQSNHVHLIVEARDTETLSRGMRSITVTMARGINLGKVQMSRYHLHVLKSLREARNAVRYVLFNEQKHTKRKTIQMDGYSSLDFLDIKTIAKKAKMTLVWNKKTRMNFLNSPGSYFLHSALRALTS